MQLFCITLLLLLHDSLSVAPTVNDDFPQMEFPQTVLDTVPYHLKKTSRVLDAFSEDVKTNFKAIENSKNSKKTSIPTLIDILAPVSNKDGSITDIHKVDGEYVPFEVNVDSAHDEEANNFKDADNLNLTDDQRPAKGSEQTNSVLNETKFEEGNLPILSKNAEVSDIECLEEVNQEKNLNVFPTGEHSIDQIIKDEGNVNTGNSDANILSNIENLNNEDTERQAEFPFVQNETESNRTKRSSNVSQESECLENIFEEDRLNGDKNETTTNYTKPTTTHGFTSSEVVLPRPPLAADYDDGIKIEDFKESNEDSLLAENCSENCVIEKTHVNDDHNEDF